MTTLLYTLRKLRKSPGFTLTALLTLTLGIGASSAIFTMVNSVLLNPLSFRDSGQLVVAWERIRPIPQRMGPNLRHLDVWKQRATDFSALTAAAARSAGVALGTEHPQQTGTLTAYPNFLHVLGAAPILGRDFNADDAIEGKQHVALISYDLWQTLFHGDPGVLRQQLRIEGTPTQIIGVLPRNFHFPSRSVLNSFETEQHVSEEPDPQIILPLAVDVNQLSWFGDMGNYLTIGRLKPGRSLAHATAELNSIEQQILQELPVNDKPEDPKNFLRAELQPMQEAIVGESARALWLLFAAVISVLLIACFNLANTQLARFATRQRELAIRSALGASSWQLISAALLEGLVLAAIGGATGMLFARQAIHALQHSAPVTIPRLKELQINWQVSLFAIALSLATCLLFSLLPILRLIRKAPQTALQGNTTRVAGSPQQYRLRSILIGAQVFGCTALLLITGTFAKSLYELLHTDRGFRTEHVMLAQVSLPRNASDRETFDQTVLDKLRALPGVQAAGLVSAMPLEGESWLDELSPADHQMENSSVANLRWTSSGYFETIQEPLLHGRFFTERDRDLKNVILSAAAAKAAWPTQDAVGRQIRRNGQLYTVVGVVADAHSNSLKHPPARMIYLPFGDRPPYTTYFAVRSSRDTATVTEEMRKVIWDSHPEATIARVKTLASQVNDSLATERLQTGLLMSFGVAALLLSVLGIYGVLSYSVASRTQEIGIRMAVGASRGDIYRLTIRSLLSPVMLGLAAGWLTSALMGRIYTKMLYGVQAGDLSVTLITVFVFMAAASTASYLPARRAASIDPLEALRME